MLRMISCSALLAGLCLTAVSTTASAAYTCTTNPAICKAICGSTTCGSFSATDRDIQRMERPGRVQNVAAQAPASRTSGKGYTCFNPAICKAVCGSTTC
jgi:hypothetical protein